MAKNNDMAEIKHKKSVKEFPQLKLIEGEYVEVDIRRSKTGLVLIWGGEILGMIILAIVGVFFGLTVFKENPTATELNMQNFMIVVYIAAWVILILFGILGSRIYKQNNMIVTNKRVFLLQSASLFNYSTNIVDLASIEDVSLNHEGLINSLLGFGTIRLATVGTETTYTFPFADISSNDKNKETIAKLVYQARKGGKG